MAITSATGYSANVALHLRINGDQLPIAQVGPGSFILREACTIPPATEAELIVKIDDYEQRLQVVLVEGATADNKAVKFRGR
jgi:hypothetical protein